jgi:hypothetical protein
MNIIYNIGSLALMGVCVFAGLNDHMLLAILYFFASMAFLFVANLQYIIKNKAPKDGFDVKGRELIQKAEVTIIEMQNLAKLVSRTALSLIKRSGRLGGYPEEEQEALKETFLRLLTDLNLSKEDRENVLEEYNKFIEMDYVFLLLGSHIPINWPKDELQKRREMLNNVVSNCPSPEQIEELLITNESLSKNHKDILEDYKFFRRYKEYRRPEMIPKYKELRNSMNL